MKNTAANGYRCPSYKCTLNHNVTMSPYSALKKYPNGQSLPKGRSGHHLWLSRAVNNLSVALQEVPNMAHKEKLTYILLSAILCFLCAPSKIYIPTLVAHNFMEMQFAWQGAKKWPTKTSNRKYFFSLLATFLRTRFFSLQFCLFFFVFVLWLGQMQFERWNFVRAKKKMPWNVLKRRRRTAKEERNRIWALFIEQKVEQAQKERARWHELWKRDG